MTGALDTTPSTIDRIRHDLVGLMMPRALEALDHVVRRLEKGEIAALEAIDLLLSEELTLRENSCIKTALRTGRHEGKGRPILPPMPWPMYGKLNDADLRAVFAYLQSLPPVKNRVPQPVDPPEAGR